MCQISETNQWNYLTEPMKVYKIMKKGVEPGYVYSCFKRKAYKIGVKHTMYLDDIIRDLVIYGDEVSVNAGIHSFVNLENALEANQDQGQFVYECRIPKGAFILKGYWDSRTPMIFPTVVSNEIIIKKVLPISTQKETRPQVTIPQLIKWLDENGHTKAATEIRKMKKNKEYRERVEFGIWKDKWSQKSSVRKYSLSNLLNNLFLWDRTPQGMHYWDNIYWTLHQLGL